MMIEWFPSIGFIGGGVGALGVVWLGWSGRWRSWAHDGHDTFVLALLPAFGLFMLAVGVAMLVSDDGGSLEGIMILILVLAPVAFVLTLLKPSWWGPRWYRERLGKEPSLADQLLRGRKPRECWPATLIDDFDRGTGTDGQIFVLRGELLFVGNRPYVETPSGRAMPLDHPLRRKNYKDAPATIQVRAWGIAEIRLCSELEWRASMDSPVRHFRPPTPFLWIEMRRQNGFAAFVVSQPEQVAQQMSSVLKRPLQDLR